MGLVLGPIGLVDVEKIGVFAESLAFLVALPLERLAMDPVDAEERVDAIVDFDDQRIVGVEVATVAGADVVVFLLLEEWRWVAALVDLDAHPPTGLGIEKVVHDV